MTSTLTAGQPTYTLSWEHRNGEARYIVGAWDQICRSGRNVMKLNLLNVEVTDERGRDVTFDVPAFAGRE